jgi:hypothetical protein
MHLMWGTVVVGGVACFGGSVAQGVGGYLVALCCVTALDKLMK